MVEGQVPAKVEVTAAAEALSAAAGVVVTAAAASTPVAAEEELPRTVTVWVTVAAAQVDEVAVVTGSVQLSPAMENLGVCA